MVIYPRGQSPRSAHITDICSPSSVYKWGEIDDKRVTCVGA